MEVFKVPVPVAVSDIVDADPDQEETVGRLPWCIGRLGPKDGDEESFDLVFERQYRWDVWSDEVGIDCCTT